MIAIAIGCSLAACSGVNETGSTNTRSANTRSANIGSAGASADSTPSSATQSTTPVAPSPISPVPDAPSAISPVPDSPSPDAPSPDAPLPESPVALSEALTEAERAIRDPTLDSPTAQRWGRRAQRLYSVLTEHREWAPETLASVGEDVALDVELNWTARQNLSALVTSTAPATELPAWRISEPLPPDTLLAYYHEAQDATGVPWSVLAAIHLIETRMGRIEGLSTAGAVGPMQFLPSTWQACCEGDPTVDRDAILGAATYLAQSGAPGNLDRAIYAYNHSDRYVSAVRAYADVLERNELAYRGLHGFEVYFLSSAGLLHLAPGYEEPEPVAAADWLAIHPDALVR